MARPKGLVKAFNFKGLTCPTLLNALIECSSEFATLSNLKGHVDFTPCFDKLFSVAPMKDGNDNPMISIR